jgi:hypothetical protein
LAEKKKANPRFTTVAAIAVWPKLNTPDTKFNDIGDYGVKLKLDPNNPLHAKQLADLDKLADDAFEAMKEENPKWKAKMVRAEPYGPEVDKDGNESGFMLVNFTCPAKFIRKSDKKEWENKPVLYDAKGTPLPSGTEVGGGSTIKVSFETWPYFNASGKEKTAGATKRLLAVQVLDLKVWRGSQDASDFGFGAEEGFDVSDPESSEAAAVPTSSSNTPASDF